MPSPQTPVSVHNLSNNGKVVLVCEHASNFVPENLDDLGVGKRVLDSHVALDIGARELAMSISKRIDAPLVASTISRLVYDCNRPPEAVDAVPTKSEIHEIPGNRGLLPEDIAERARQYYAPFEQAVAETMAVNPKAALITIHSFTPTYHGKNRAVDIGILHDRGIEMADTMLETASDYTDLNVERNQPYGPRDGVAHTLNLHGNQHNRPNVMIEVKNTLLTSQQQIQDMSELLSSWLVNAISNLKTLN